MDKSQKRVRPGFVLSVIVIFAIFVWLVSGGAPGEKAKTHARITKTHVEERLIAAVLTIQALKVGGITNLTREFVLNSLQPPKDAFDKFTWPTNTSGKLIDPWQTPFQINLVGPTNFMIHSAGPNLKFGDGDDIIFNSASNDFAKP